MSTSRYRQALDPIGAKLDWLSLLTTMALLYIKICMNLATSYQFCLHLNLKSHMCAYLKNWRVKFGEMYQFAKFTKVWPSQNLGILLTIYGDSVISAVKFLCNE